MANQKTAVNARKAQSPYHGVPRFHQTFSFFALANLGIDRIGIQSSNINQRHASYNNGII